MDTTDRDLTKIVGVIGELKSDIKWIRDALEGGDKKYARKWVEMFVYVGMAGMLGWAVKNILDLIPVARALF